MFFVSSEKLISFSRYLIFCHDFLVMLKKLLDLKGKVNFEFHDVINWLASNYNTHIAKYLAKQRQLDNETWSFNVIY